MLIHCCQLNIQLTNYLCVIYTITFIPYHFWWMLPALRGIVRNKPPSIGTNIRSGGRRLSQTISSVILMIDDHHHLQSNDTLKIYLVEEELDSHRDPLEGE